MIIFNGLLKDLQMTTLSFEFVIGALLRALRERLQPASFGGHHLLYACSHVGVGKAVSHGAQLQHGAQEIG